MILLLRQNRALNRAESYKFIRTKIGQLVADGLADGLALGSVDEDGVVRRLLAVVHPLDPTSTVATDPRSGAVTASRRAVGTHLVPTSRIP